MPPAGAAIAPAQLLPTFEKAAATTGVPKEILLAIARVESGFDPRAVGPYLAQFAGTENQHALGMMQFLPSTYRPYAARIDGITGKNLGMAGIWDAESAIYAAAFYLKDSGAPGDLRRALFAYNNADWYVDLILAWAASYAGGLVADPNFTLGPGGGGQPLITVAPENPLQPALTGRHLDALSAIPLYLPFTAGADLVRRRRRLLLRRRVPQRRGRHVLRCRLQQGDLAAQRERRRRAGPGRGRWPDQQRLRHRGRRLDGGDLPPLAAWDACCGATTCTSRTIRGSAPGSRSTSRCRTARRSASSVTPGPPPPARTSTSGWRSGRATGGCPSAPSRWKGSSCRAASSLVSHNDPANKAAFDTAWNTTDRQVYTSQRQSWLWGPQPFAGAVLERDGKDTVRVVQYWDKGRMERISDGQGGFLTSVGKLAWEMLTGKIDLGDNVSTEVGAAKIPLVGPLKDTERNVAALALGQPAPEKLAPTYADAAVEAAKRTSNYAGAPVNWLLRPGGTITPFAEGTQPPALVTLTGYDEVTGHNVADVFAQWYQQTFLTSPDGDPQHSLYAQLQGNTAGLDPGHPLTDPFWVQVTVDGIDRVILVQVFERWTLTYSPHNPAGWQIELGNVGQHYYEWRYEAPLREAHMTSPGQGTRRRRTTRKESA